MKAALRIIIFMVVLGAASGLLLSGVNTLTASRIALNEELKLKSSILDALDITYAKDNIIGLFEESVKVIKDSGLVFYRGQNNGVAFEFNGPGLWGPIYGIVCLDSDLRTIRSIKIMHQEETPGLGGRIAENAYLSQFKAKEISPRLNFVAEGRAKAANEVDAITGATGSSKAFEKLLNETIQKNLKALQQIRL